MRGILLDLFVLFVAAKLAGVLFERLRQPPVIGELLVGALIGPHALRLVGVPDGSLVASMLSVAAAQETLATVYEVLAELGVIVLLFLVS